MNRVTRVQVAAGLLVGVVAGLSRLGFLSPAALASVSGFLGGGLLAYLLPDRHSLRSDCLKAALLGALVLGAFIVVGIVIGRYAWGTDEFVAMVVIGPVAEVASMALVYFLEAYAAAAVVRRLR